jgi:hypothetical protein
VLLGTNGAPNAVEALLHALSSCMTVAFIYLAAAGGHPSFSNSLSGSQITGIRYWAVFLRDQQAVSKVLEVIGFGSTQISRIARFQVEHSYSLTTVLVSGLDRRSFSQGLA